MKLKKSKWGSGSDSKELYTALWACPECGLTVPSVYDEEEIDIDEKEICPRCDSEMKYITDEEFEEGIKEWLRRMKESCEEKK